MNKKQKDKDQTNYWTPFVKKGSQFMALKAQHTGVGVDTPYGNFTVEKGDYVIQWPNGDMFICKPDVFKRKYEKIKE